MSRAAASSGYVAFNGHLWVPGVSRERCFLFSKTGIDGDGFEDCIRVYPVMIQPELAFSPA